MKRALRVLAILLAAYYVITLLIITPALNILPGWYVDKTWGRTLQTRWVILNPFKLSLDIASASLSEPNGERFLDIGESSVNLSLSSLWRKGIVLDELRVHDLYVNLVREGETRFNFSDLLPAQETAEPEEDSGPPPGITIQLLDITSQAIVVNDQTRELPYRSEWTGLSLNVQDLSTVIEEGKPYRLQVSGPNGGSLSWEGTLSLPGQFTEGSFTLQDVHLPSLWQAAEPWLVFEVQDGRLALAADYRVSWKEPLAYRLGGGRFGLSGVAIAPRDAAALPDTGIALGSLAVEDIEVDSETLSATVGAVTLEGLVANGFSEGSQISLADMLIGPADPNEPAAAETPPDSEDAAAPQWQASVARLQISDSAINWRSQYTEPALMAVTPIAATASNLQWPLGGTLPFELKLAINDTAGLEVQGQVEMDSGQAEIDYALSALPLAWFDPNLPEALNATIMGGEAAVQGNVTLRDFAPATVALDAAITDFAVRQQGVETQFTRWKAVRANGLSVDLDAQNVSLAELDINDYSGRIHIYKDGSVNASKIWQAELESAQAAANSEQTAETASPASSPDGTEVDAGEDSGSWAVTVNRILLSDSEVDFMDESLPITFRAVIGELNGHITGISSAADASAEVDIEGAVNGTAPVTLTGTASPLADPMALDLELNFNDVDMALLTPYSGTYAGYKIQSGLLDLELDYTLENDLLKGENTLRLAQFKLGEKVESDKAINAPLELAIAIMTDSNGIIDLSVPVSGSVDDPNFALGSVIGKAIVGVITGIVSAPFKALASLVGSEADLHLLAFAPGSAELNTTARDKLADLTEALTQRPQIKLTLDGRVDPEADRERLQLDALHTELLADGLAPQALESKDESWRAAIDNRFAQLPGALDAEATITAREKQRQVAATFNVSDEQLVALAQARALAVKTYLIDQGGVTPDRAVIAATSLPDDAHRFSGVELDIR